MRTLKPGTLAPNLANEMARLGDKIARLRRFKRVKQEVAAMEAGLARDTAYRIEKGESNVAIGQILRYLDAISPGLTLRDALNDCRPDLAETNQHQKRRRVRSGASTAAKDNQGGLPPVVLD